MKLLKLLVMSALINAVTIFAVVYYFPQKTPVAITSLVANNYAPFEQDPSLIAKSDVSVESGKALEVLDRAQSGQAVVTNTNTAAAAEPQNKQQTATAPKKQEHLPSGCLIKIYDGIYNLTEFRSIHSGGDIFQCNTDMTQIFSSEHPKSYLSSIEKYRVK